MKKLEGYMAGVNLGHWISQYGTKSKEHFDSYITDSDFVRIANWGMDHIRMPFDYFMIEDDEKIGEYLADGLYYLDYTLEHCKKNGLNLVMDLHHAPGFFFGDGDKNTLFTDPVMQKRYINIWKFLAERYANEGNNLIFELMNEVVWKNSEPWNELWQRTVSEIEKISPQRHCIIGGNSWNSINELVNLKVVEDSNVIYNFHAYEPFMFTHQRASWMENMRNYTKPVTYPFEVKDHLAFFGGKPWGNFAKYDIIDKRFLYDFFAPAIEFIKKHNRPLYCGEFGVIFNADIESMENWYSDMCDIFNEYGIGHAVWSYRGFSKITDNQNQVVSEKMIKLLAAH